MRKDEKKRQLQQQTGEAPATTASAVPVNNQVIEEDVENEEVESQRSNIESAHQPGPLDTDSQMNDSQE